MLAVEAVEVQEMTEDQRVLAELAAVVLDHLMAVEKVDLVILVVEVVEVVHQQLVVELVDQELLFFVIQTQRQLLLAQV